MCLDRLAQRVLSVCVRVRLSVRLGNAVGSRIGGILNRCHIRRRDQRRLIIDQVLVVKWRLGHGFGQHLRRELPTLQSKVDEGFVHHQRR